MILKVLTAEWVLEEDMRILRVGDDIRSWLTFREVGPADQQAPSVQVVRGRATPLPSWPGAEHGRHPVRIDVTGAALYWDAPAPVGGPVEGPIEVTGTVETNNIDAPTGFPETAGVIRGLWMVWRRPTRLDATTWTVEGEPRYEEVQATYLPGREVDLERDTWTGVLMDVEVAGMRDESTTPTLTPQRDDRLPDRLLSPDGRSGWYAVRPDGGRLEDEDEPWTAPPVGSTLRFMGEYSVDVPLWDDDGLMFGSGEELVERLGVSPALVGEIVSWADDWHQRMGRPDHDAAGEELARRLEADLDGRYRVVYQR